MGKYEVGVLGNFDGKIGTVVGARWKGIEYMRHKGRKSTKPFTKAQLEQQAKFALVTKFVHKLSKVLMTCYSDSTKLTGINHAFTDIYKNALTGVYPSFNLDYSKVLIGKGELHCGNSPAAQAAGSGIVKFTWTDNSDGNMANTDDKSVLVVYCPELEECIYTLNGAERSTGAATLNVINFTGKDVETWISFITADGNIAATSKFTGQVTVS